MKNILMASLFFCALIGLSKSECRAAFQKPNAQEPNALVNKHFDESCFAYLRVNLSTVDFKELSGTIQELAGKESKLSESIENLVLPLDQLRKKLVEAGAREFFFVFSFNELNFDDFFGFISTGDNDARKENVQKLIAEFDRPKVFVTKSSDGGVLLGTEAQIYRVMNRGMRVRTDAEAILKLGRDNAMSIVLAPSFSQARAIRELTPEFPNPWTNFTGKLLSDGVRSVVVGLNSKPKTVINISIKSKDETSSQNLATEIGSLLGLAEKQQIEMLPWLAEPAALICKSLKIEQTGDETTTHLDFSNIAVRQRFSEAFQPAVKAFEANQAKLLTLDNIREIVISMHNFHDANKALPAYATFDDLGNPLLSWRVQVLQFTEYNKLYSEFHLDEPWDSTHNIKLVEKIPAMYVTDEVLGQQGKTTLLIPFGEGFAGGKTGMRLQDFRDGTSRTIVIADLKNEFAVPWTKPADWEIDLKNSLDQLRRDENGAFMIGLADGSSHNVVLDANQLRDLLTTDGGEIVDIHRDR